jgi:hypothetical protein
MTGRTTHWTVSPHRGPLEVPVDQWVYDTAQRRVEDWHTTHDVSKAMRKEEGREVGAFGEVVAEQYLSPLPVTVRDDSVVDHDYRVGALTVDVKTKERTVPPALGWECTVAAYLRERQHPDRYLFVSLMGNGDDGVHRFVRAWVVGTILADRFWSEAKFWKAGEVDESNGWRATIDCWSVPGTTLDWPLVVTQQQEVSNAG